MANPWFRTYTEMIDDEKLRLLAFEDRWHFMALLCCKGAELLDAGDPPELMRRKVALKLGLSTRELEEVARRLSEVGLIHFETFQPLAWDARQFKSDSSTGRVRKHRNKAKRECNVSSPLQKQPGSVSATPPDAETDADTEKEQKKRAPRAPVLPDWLSVDAWGDWHTYRQRRSAKAWTEKAQELSLATLTKLHNEGHDPVAAINTSIEQGWAGLFAPKVSTPPPKQHTGFASNDYSKDEAAWNN